MSQDMMSTKEVAKYLDIHEKQVYALIREDKIPCTKVTGKWIFPKNLIDDWIQKSAKSGMKEARAKSLHIAGSLLAAGSNDPVLDVLIAFLREAHPDFYIFSAGTGSMEGLSALKRGYVDLAWCHLFHPETGLYNIPYVERLLPGFPAVVVNLFRREVGLLTALGNPLKIKGIKDLVQDGRMFVNRQEGSGIRLLFDHLLLREGIVPETVAGYGRKVSTHLDVGIAVLSGEADTGIATVAVARLLNLDFIPITTESFDMVISKSGFFEKPVQTLIDMLRSPEFKDRVRNLGEYDFTGSGKILYSSPEIKEGES